MQESPQGLVTASFVDIVRPFMQHLPAASTFEGAAAVEPRLGSGWGESARAMLGDKPKVEHVGFKVGP